jgi:hypothetical protein
VPAWSSTATRRAAWALPAIVVCVLALPLFTDRTFGYDWPDHLWLVWQQAQSISQLGHPSYFLQAYQGVFEPFFAFYGGTFYSATGALADLIGHHPTVAYCAVIIAAFAGAYAGWTWLALQAGLRGWRAQMPGALYVTAPYIITTPFGRGDVPESVGTCAIPLVAASALAVLRAERVRPLHAAVLVLSTAWFTGCHNITSLWGTTFLAATALVLAIAVGRRSVGLRRVLQTLGLAALGAAINAWWLFPTLAYANTAAIAHGGVGAFQFDSWGLVFDPFRSQPEHSTAGILNTEMPVLAAVWALAVLAVAWRRMPTPWRRFAAGMVVIVVALLALILSNMSIVPRPWSQIQFPYRAQTYVALGVCAAVLAGAAAVPFIARRLVRGLALGSLALVAAISFGQAIHQQWRQPSELAFRQLIFQPESKFPPSWYAQFDYADVALKAFPFGAMVQIPNMTVTGGNGESILPIPTGGHGDVSTITFPSPGPNKLIATNMYGGPYLIKVTGARIVGRTPSNEVVIQTSTPAGQQARVVVSTNHPAPVVLGIATTLAAIALCLLLAWWVAWRTLRERGFRLARRRRAAV